MWKTAITLCGFYTRHVYLIALILSAAFAAYFAVTGDPGSISFDLFVLFYGGLAGYAVAGCLMVPGVPVPEDRRCREHAERGDLRDGRCPVQAPQESGRRKRRLSGPGPLGQAAVVFGDDA